MKVADQQVYKRKMRAQPNECHSVFWHALSLIKLSSNEILMVDERIFGESKHFSVSNCNIFQPMEVRALGITRSDLAILYARIDYIKLLSKL